MKKDLNCHEATYLNWKKAVEEEGSEGLSNKNSDLLKKYVFDMEQGINIAKRSKKGGRGYGRLNVSRRKLTQIFKLFESEGIKDISHLKDKVDFLHKWADDLYKGRIKREDGKPYEAPAEFIRSIKAFWHWWMKVNRKLYHSTNGKEGEILEDITEDLEVQTNESRFVYFSKEQLEKMLPFFTEDEQIVCLFLFDSIIRFPTEISSLKVKDIYEKNGSLWVHIPDSVSKTFGREFNLLYCEDALKDYLRKKELNSEDDLFPVIRDYNRIGQFNKKLKQVAVQVLGDKMSHPKAERKFSEMSGYDFRHSGAIHLRQLAQRNSNITLDAIRQRGGWTDFDMLNYYTKFLGLTGEIKKEDLLITEDKTRLEKDLEELKKKLTTEIEERKKETEAKIKEAEARIKAEEEKAKTQEKNKELDKEVNWDNMVIDRMIKNPAIIPKIVKVMERIVKERKQEEKLKANAT